MNALFACTKCYERHKYEDLSQSLLLCKNCRINVKNCFYCQNEFQPQSQGRKVCRKCASFLKLYGKPRSCQICGIKAAFEDSRCHRCINCAREYGSPQICCQCKQRCAWDKKDGKQEDQLLCWLCITSSEVVHHSSLQNHKRSSSNSSELAPSETDFVIVEYQLQEKIDLLELQLLNKDKQMMMREKKDAEEIGEIKANIEKLKLKIEGIKISNDKKVENLQSMVSLLKSQISNIKSSQKFM